LAVDYRLVAIEPSQLGDVWSVIEPLMFEVVEHSAGRHTMQTLIDAVMSGEFQLWAVVDDDGLRVLSGTRIDTAPSGMRHLEILFVVGRHMKDWVRFLIGEFEEYARMEHCAGVEMYARKGLAKYLNDYKLTHICLEKDLT